MFTKILIANRGEIACRIIRTAKRMGIATVAVYSEADRDALHVLSADEAVCIGPPPSTQSYLDIDAIVQACRDTGAQAVHPGYGFLSENERFAAALEQAGVTFIGPPSGAIGAMGDKLTAKRLAKEAGVSVVPGFDGAIASPDHAVQIARDIGYPVMLKAAAGGGGKGMRLAHDDAECREGFARATSEAKAAFGDGRVFIEKFIEQPRHIEIQVLADAHGQCFYLGERECSLQRRHQKVIEEAPSPFLDEATRVAMGEQACALAAKVGYRSAGTVEFIVGADRAFFFLEMNTRLQVEHPVTEFVTGLDLVELMIRVAAGEKLSLNQKKILDRFNNKGWAIEGRIYAEDPFRNFLPSTGRLVKFSPPPASPSVRVDTGVYEGAEVSMHYDPMIAKLVTFAPDRPQAIEKMRDALNRFTIRGVAHNISFLAALIEHRRFRMGRMTTSMIAEEYPHGFRAEDLVHDAPELLICAAAAIHRRYMDRAAQITGQLPGYERHVHDDWVVSMRGHEHPVTVRPAANPPGSPGSPTAHEVKLDGQLHRVQSDWQFGHPLFTGTFDGQPVCLQVERRHLVYRLFHWGAQVDCTVLTKRAAELQRLMPKRPPRDTSNLVLSPMPGLLAAVLVKEEQEVSAGQDLAVVEAMKMENVIRSPRDGRIAKVLANTGESLVVDQPILQFA